MVKLKLARVGKKKQPEYRIIVVERGKDPWGPNNEVIGHYNPRTDKNPVEFKIDRVQYWLSVGAQPTDTVHNMLVSAGLLKAEKRRKVSISKKRHTAMDAQKVKAEAEKEKAEAAKHAAAAAKAAEEKAAAEKAAADAIAAEAAAKAEAEAPASSPDAAPVAEAPTEESVAPAPAPAAEDTPAA